MRLACRSVTDADEVAYETERLVVRAWTDDDVERFEDTYRRWEVMRWLGTDPKVVTGREDALARIARFRGRASADGRLGIWAIEVRDTGLVAGTVLLAPLHDGAGAPTGDTEVGWHLHPDSWGHGYATESARGAIAKGLREGLDEIWAIVVAENDRSLAVTRRLGMVAQGPTSKYYGMEFESFVTRGGSAPGG